LKPGIVGFSAFAGKGYNLFGQLGIGNTTNQSSPVQILTLSNIVAIAAGSYHSLALQADGSVSR
jgi:Alpha-tubulin suppressor and related RCC1 domain-containing proteins